MRDGGDVEDERARQGGASQRVQRQFRDLRRRGRQDIPLAAERNLHLLCRRQAADGEGQWSRHDGDRVAHRRHGGRSGRRVPRGERQEVGLRPGVEDAVHLLRRLVRRPRGGLRQKHRRARQHPRRKASGGRRRRRRRCRRRCRICHFQPVSQGRRRCGGGPDLGDQRHDDRLPRGDEPSRRREHRQLCRAERHAAGHARHHQSRGIRHASGVLRRGRRRHRREPEGGNRHDPHKRRLHHRRGQGDRRGHRDRLQIQQEQRRHLHIRRPDCGAWRQGFLRFGPLQRRGRWRRGHHLHRFRTQDCDFRRHAGGLRRFGFQQ